MRVNNTIANTKAAADIKALCEGSADLIRVNGELQAALTYERNAREQERRNMNCAVDELHAECRRGYATIRERDERIVDLERRLATADAMLTGRMPVTKATQVVYNNEGQIETLLHRAPAQ